MSLFNCYTLLRGFLAYGGQTEAHLLVHVPGLCLEESTLPWSRQRPRGGGQVLWWGAGFGPGGPWRQGPSPALIGVVGQDREYKLGALSLPNSWFGSYTEPSIVHLHRHDLGEDPLEVELLGVVHLDGEGVGGGGRGGRHPHLRVGAHLSDQLVGVRVDSVRVPEFDVQLFEDGHPFADPLGRVDRLLSRGSLSFLGWLGRFVPGLLGVGLLLPSSRRLFGFAFRPRLLSLHSE